MDEFAKYQPLFLSAQNKNQIGICKWIEGGRSIETAVPELYELTDDKEEWRAVIVRVYDDTEMSRFTNRPENPYDFISDEPQNLTQESEIPLIRLTHMLGGIPAFEVKFTAKVVEEDGKVPHTIYVPDDDEDERSAYELLKKKYEFDGHPPKSIILISIRKNYVLDDLSTDVWNDYRESDSSEFWKRNHYPSVCRFLAFDIPKQGTIQKNADSFSFWTAVLMIALNEIDPGTLQAYRLYKFGIGLDRDALADNLQKSSSMLRAVRGIIERSISAEAAKQAEIITELPDYSTKVEVQLPRLDTDEIYADDNFDLFSDSIYADETLWRRETDSCEQTLRKTIKYTGRALDKEAESHRLDSRFDPSEVKPLDKYQKEDLQEREDVMYAQVVELQGQLPSKKVADSSELKSKAQDVADKLKGRITGKSAAVAFISAFVLAFLTQAGALTEYFVDNTGNIYSICGIAAVEMLAIFIAGMIAVLIEKSKLRVFVQLYNNVLEQAYNRLSYNTEAYQNYMGNIVSLCKACSYANESERILLRETYAYNAKYVHLRAIDSFLARIRVWDKAFHLGIDLSQKDEEFNVTANTSVAPGENEMYSFRTVSQHDVRINNTSGTFINSPFDFVDSLQITREELYDDRNRRS